MKIKYILHPGFVSSKSDGDRHYVGAAELARLYGVDMRECITAELGCRFSADFLNKLTALYPSQNGNYPLLAEREVDRDN